MPTAYSAPRNTREPNWKNAKDQMSHENAVGGGERGVADDRPQQQRAAAEAVRQPVTKKATNNPSSIGMRVTPSVASLTRNVLWMFGSSSARIELS